MLKHIKSSGNCTDDAVTCSCRKCGKGNVCDVCQARLAVPRGGLLRMKRHTDFEGREESAGPLFYQPTETAFASRTILADNTRRAHGAQGDPATGFHVFPA